MEEKKIKDSVLIIVDVQKDFCPGGALAVPRGDETIPVINHITEKFPLIVATKDWHKKEDISFYTNHENKEPFQKCVINNKESFLWPEHCIRMTDGAELHPQLDLSGVNLILHKSTYEEFDSYSAFFEDDKELHTGLHYFLRGLGIRKVYLTGLALNVCVYQAALDSIKLGYKTKIIKDGTEGVDFPEGAIDKSISDMKNKGVDFIYSSELE